MKKPKLNTKLQRIVDTNQINRAINGARWGYGNPYQLSRKEIKKLKAYQRVFTRLFIDI